jgi:hypothetical protein
MNMMDNFGNFGQLTKILLPDKPPSFIWNLNGHDVKFTVNQMSDYRLFHKQCIQHELITGEYLGVRSPDIETKAFWTSAVQGALKTVKVVGEK